MQQSNLAKDRILNKIKQALVHPVPLPFTANNDKNEPFFQKSEEELTILFAENFTHLQGRFVYCENENDAAEQIHTLINTRKWQKVFCNETGCLSIIPQLPLTNNLAIADASITSCEALVARTGSFMLSSANESGRTASVYAPVHICVAYTNQLVYDIKDALALVQEKYKQSTLPSVVSLASGPSRTADIEKTLVVGVHGPKEVFCFLIEN
jgi:L-lactate dehydrogenase complex protein LldG